MTMRHLLLPLCGIALWLSACQDSTPSRPTTALETGRTFIQASLKGDFPAAQPLVLPDSENQSYFQAFQGYYRDMPEDVKARYKSSDYTIERITEPDDSTLIIHYANDYMKKPMDIRVVRRTGTWYVDFTALNTDTTGTP